MPELSEMLRAYADEGGPLDLDEVRARVLRHRRKRRALVGAVAAAALVVVAVALVAVGDDGQLRVTSPAGGRPDEFVALGRDGALTVRDSADGEVMRTLAHLSVGGPGQITVSPDGEVFVSRARRHADGECVPAFDTQMEEIVAISVETGQLTAVGRGAWPTVSPDGNHLAYTRPTGGVCRRGEVSDEVVVADLATGAETVLGPPEGYHVAMELSWAPNSRHLALLLQKPDNSSYPHIVDTARATSLGDARPVPMSDSHGWHGYLGADRFLASYLPGQDTTRPSALVALDAATGAEVETLVELDRAQAGWAEADATGGHLIFATTAERGKPAALLRWSRGDAAPRRLAGEALTVAWLTGDTPETPEPGEAPAGWSEVDPGPLSPRQGASLTWTGSEIIVLGGERHRDGAAFDPGTRTWHGIADPPLPAGVAQTTWTGSELLAVTDADGSRHAAAYDPTADRWRTIAAPPPTTHPNLGGVVDPGFYWAEHEAILADAWAAYNPAADQWRPLPTPPPEDPLTQWPRAVAVHDRTLWVLAAQHDTWRLDLDRGSYDRLPALPHDSTIIGDHSDAHVIDGTLYFANEDGRISRFRNGGWETAHPAALPGDGYGPCIPRVLSAGGTVAVDSCGILLVEQPNGVFNDTASIGACCYPALVPTDASIFAWDSNDDTTNDSRAPFKHAYIWKPPKP